MRVAATSIAVLVVAAVLSAQAPQPQAPPVFRAGIELLTVDVTALDGNGRQVTNLAVGEFAVDVDGNARQVVSADYVRLVDPLRVIGAPRPVVSAPDETFFTSNAKGAPRGRLIVLLVDQGNIRSGAARPAMNSAKKFVDTLTPEDRVAVIAVPSPGEMVDFTTDHDKVREALLRITGVAQPIKLRFNLSMTEAMALYMRSDDRLATEVIARECAVATVASDFDRCERDVEQDAGEIVSELRHRTDDSVRSMRAVLQGLAAVEGPKSVVIVSEGLVLDGLTGDVDDLASVAADARASVDVLLLDVPRYDVAQSTRPTTPKEDRDLQVNGLESLAGATRGNLYRINTSAEYAFDRISRALDGYYLLGVEARPEDRNGKRHRLTVKSSRRGVTIQSRRTFLTSVSAKATSPADAVTRALRSPLPLNDLPLRVATWIYKEPGTGRGRMLIGAEIERLADQPLQYTAGIMLINRDNRGMAPPVDAETLEAKAGEPGTAVYSRALTIEPGTYRLRLAMADSEGRVGSVERRVDVFQLDGPALALGDLLVGGLAASEPRPLAPAIEPVVTTGQMAALTEVYGAAGVLTGVEGTLEILADVHGTPIATQPMVVGPGPSPEITAVRALVSTTALPPGRYLARTTIRQGGQVHGAMVRPFRVMAAPAAEPTPAGVFVAAPGGTLPVEMASVLLGSLPAFDRKELLSPAMLSPVLAVAEGRPAASKAAVKEARAGALGAAAMTALGDGDQAFATFLKGLDLLSQSQLDRAAVQFQTAMQVAPTFAPARMYFGATLAEANRHREAAGLLQSAAEPNMVSAALPRITGEEWMKAGQPGLAVAPLEAALQLGPTDARTSKLLGLAYVLGNRPADALPVLTPYLDAHPSDQAALLAGIYAAYARHASEPRRDTLAADRDHAVKWSKAYATSGGPMQPLVGAWVKYLLEIR